jgi:hypothetical protein
MPSEESAEPFDVDAEFTAIVSGISGQMHWGATVDDLDAAADQVVEPPAEARTPAEADIWQPGPIGVPGAETADDRKRRRQLRRWEREAALEAFHEAQAEIRAEREADTEHFEPPPPPPLPRPRRRTVGAVLLMVVGIVVLVSPRLMAVGENVTLVVGLLLILGGLALLMAGLRRRPGEPGDGWDDGAVV